MFLSKNGGYGSLWKSNASHPYPHDSVHQLLVARETNEHSRNIETLGDLVILAFQNDKRMQPCMQLSIITECERMIWTTIPEIRIVEFRNSADWVMLQRLAQLAATAIITIVTDARKQRRTLQMQNNTEKDVPIEIHDNNIRARTTRTASRFYLTTTLPSFYSDAVASS